MPDLVANIIKLLVGAALFLIGMNMMSSGLKKIAGGSLKRLFNRLKNSRFVTIGIGAGVTAIIQSSGATAAMTIGFINAGVMTILQGICVILGAYIGTTITGIIVSFSSFSFSQYLVLTVVVGVILTFFKNPKVKNIGEILAGLGVLFFGLETMQIAFKGDTNELLNAFKTLFQAIDFPLLLLLIGALFTGLTQSSSATSGIVITMALSGAITTDDAFYLVIGATIGTVITTLIASIGGRVEAKRTAWICLVLRTISALLVTVIVWIIEANTSGAIAVWMVSIFGGNVGFAIAIFLVAYNVITIPLLMPLLNKAIDISSKLIKDKDEINRRKAIKFIDDRMIITPTIALSQAKNEILNMLELSKKNIALGYQAIITQDLSNEEEITEREDSIDYLNKAITDFLIKLSYSSEMHEEKKIGAYFHTINDIERIGDHAYNFLDIAKEMKENDLHFSENATKELNALMAVIDEMFEVTLQVFNTRDYDRLIRLHSLEDETDKMKHDLSTAHFIRITQNKCLPGISPYFTSLLSELERVADHLVNVGYSIINPTGEVTEINYALKK